jgi:hypothetical protein
MVKQKNDTLEGQRKRAKRLKITVALLIVAALGLGATFLPIIGNRGSTIEYKVFPDKARIGMRFCVPYGDDGPDDLVSILFGHAELYLAEFYIDGALASDDDIETRRMGSVGHLLSWCYAPGLAQGVYQMEFQLKDLQDQLIRAHQWTLTVTP